MMHSKQYYLWLYGIKYMVKNNKNKERKPAAATTWASFLIAARDLLFSSSHRQESTLYYISWSLLHQL